jgi:glyoxylase-like metal-dependent hydrolase (beta-lactamase superfamily II)
MIEFEVIQFVNPYKSANTFVIEINQNDILIIDFGNYPLKDFCDWVIEKNKNILALILTHEHADHCYGVDALKKHFHFPLYCSAQCEVNMRNPKRNYSRYIEDFETFGVQSKAIIITDGEVLNFKGFELIVMETPGHSQGSICLFAGDDKTIFTGDTILNSKKSPLGFPHSNKIDYAKSLRKIINKVNKQSIIFPGHGNSFAVKDINWGFYL